MLFSVGCEYGIQALTRLASQVPPGRFRLLRDIVGGIDLPQHFVGKIFQALVRGDILISAKGRGGGFALKRPPDHITLREIVEAIDGTVRRRQCFVGFANCDGNGAPAHARCMHMRRQIDELLDQTTLSHLIQKTAVTDDAVA